MDVTPAAIVTPERYMQSRNAEFPMAVTVPGTVTVPVMPRGTNRSVVWALS